MKLITDPPHNPALKGTKSTWAIRSNSSTPSTENWSAMSLRHPRQASFRGIIAKLQLPQSQKHKYLLSDTAHTLTLILIGHYMQYIPVGMTVVSEQGQTEMLALSELCCLSKHEEGIWLHLTQMPHSANTRVINVHNLRKKKPTTRQHYCCSALRPSAEHFLNFCLAAELAHCSNFESLLKIMLCSSQQPWSSCSMFKQYLGQLGLLWWEDKTSHHEPASHRPSSCSAECWKHFLPGSSLGQTSLFITAVYKGY